MKTNITGSIGFGDGHCKEVSKPWRAEEGRNEHHHAMTNCQLQRNEVTHALNMPHVCANALDEEWNSQHRNLPIATCMSSVGQTM